MNFYLKSQHNYYYVDFSIWGSLYHFYGQIIIKRLLRPFLILTDEDQSSQIFQAS